MRTSHKRRGKSDTRVGKCQHRKGAMWSTFWEEAMASPNSMTIFLLSSVEPTFLPFGLWYRVLNNERSAFSLLSITCGSE